MAKIRRKKNGNYEARIVIGHTADGKPIQKRFTSFDRADLKRQIAEAEAKHKAIVRRVTVEQMIGAFLAAKFPVLSPSTYKGYKSLQNNITTKYGQFCSEYADNITTNHIQGIVNDLILSANTPKTIRNYIGFLSAVFKHSGYTLPPVTLPQPVKPTINIPEQEQMQDILTAAAGSRLEIPLALAAMGLRRSEICALSLSDLDGDLLHIHKSAVYGDDKAVHIKTTKNYTSDRKIVIPAPLADKIRAQGYVWNASPIALSDAFTKFISKNGFPHYRLHDLRHFFASYCHNVLKLSDKQIQAMTGHKTPDVLRNVYLHTMTQETVNRTAASSIGNLMAK